MRSLAFAVVAISFLGSANTVRAQDNNKDTIVGVWEIVYSDAKDVPVGTKLEFTKDNKLKLTVKVDGKEVTVEAGGYKIEKDVITLTGKDGDKNDKGRICLLNKSTFIINDEIEDKVMVLKRAKAK